MADNTENAANEPVPSADQPDKKTDDFSEELPQDPGSEAPLNPAAAPKADAPRRQPRLRESPKIKAIPRALQLRLRGRQGQLP
jgi:hypothetical protein